MSLGNCRSKASRTLSYPVGCSRDSLNSMLYWKTARRYLEVRL
jgi:hypothetical protein